MLSIIIVEGAMVEEDNVDGFSVDDVNGFDGIIVNGAIEIRVGDVVISDMILEVGGKLLISIVGIVVDANVVDCSVTESVSIDVGAIVCVPFIFVLTNGQNTGNASYVFV
jgi:hypothetical protein